MIEAKRNLARDMFVRETMNLAKCPWLGGTFSSIYDYAGFLSKLASEIGAPYWPPFSQVTDVPSLKLATAKLSTVAGFRRTCGSCRQEPAKEKDRVSADAVRAASEVIAEQCEGLC